MKLLHYIFSSFQIFIITFILGVSIDKYFEFLQKKYKLTPLFVSLLQLLTIFIISFYFYNYSLSKDIFDYNLRHLSFSSFLFSLQQNLINNFKLIFFT